MTLNATNVRVGITGEVYRGTLASPAPTTAVSVLDTTFKGLGYISEDGVTENWDDSVDNIVAWQNATTVRASTTESTASLSFMLIETTGIILETFHRGSTMAQPTAGNFRLDVKPVTADPRKWVLDVLDGSKAVRIYVGNGEITERGEIVYQNGEPVGYPITITCYPDANGNLMQKFSNDTAWTTT